MVVVFIHIAYRCICTKYLDTLQKTKQNFVSLKFKHNMVQTYLVTYKNLPKHPGPSTTIPHGAQYNERNYLVEPVANGTRCARTFYQSKGCTQCKKYNVGLYATCFI